MKENEESKMQELEKHLKTVKKHLLEEHFGYPITEEEAANMELPDEVLESLGDL